MSAPTAASSAGLVRASVLIVTVTLLRVLAASTELAPQAPAFEPATGALIFFVYRWGAACLPAAALALLLPDYRQFSGTVPLAGHLHTLGELLAYGVLALFVRQRNWLNFPVTTLQGALRVVAVSLAASLQAALLAVLIDGPVVPAQGGVPADGLIGHWIGDFSGCLMFLGAASVTLSLASQRLLPSGERSFGSAQALGLAAVILAVVLQMPAFAHADMLRGYSYLILLPVIAGTLVWGLQFGIAAAVLTNLTAVLAYLVLKTEQMDALQLQVLCAVVATVGTLLGAAVDDRRSWRFDARYDPLTGLLNRRALFELAPQLLARARRAHSGVAVIGFDLDRFSQLAGHWGQDAGDQLLGAVAAACRRRARTSDLCARFGGDEFVLIVECRDIAPALALAEDLRQAIAAQQRGPSNETASASLGVAWQAAEEATLEHLLHDADRLRYAARERGGNQVASAVASELASAPGHAA